MKTTLVVTALTLVTAAVQAQSLTKEEYESFHLKRIATMNCASKNGERIILKSNDRGKTYNLMYAQKAHEQPLMLVRGAHCEDFGPRNWGLHCMDKQGKTMFHVSATGYYVHRANGRSYDHNVDISLVPSAIERLQSMGNRRLPYLVESFSSKCLIQRD